MEDPSLPQGPDNVPFRFNRREISETQINQSWNRIAPALGRNARRSPRRRMLRMAAAVLLIPAIAYGGYSLYCNLMADGMRVYRTAYGEMQQVLLPDSSTVYLNANSTLRIPEEWKSEESRSVYLDGEAYFEITKRPGAADARFIVHTPEIDVEVLGTKFNVNMLEARTTVSLKEGKVQLTAKSEISEGPKVIMMKPGDEVLVDHEKSRLRESVNTDQIADWRNHRYHFENTSMQEIAAIIRTKFGYEVTLSAAAAKRTISGDLYAQNIEQLSKALSVTMNLQIEQSDGELLITTKD
ncbi:FecR family protein [Chitinophaga deserti]|uniref:FecR family protein n=1 Tax=Chitinophaga deserti TaxID=2164099 RepID=UPI000D6AFE8F|nr:FecR domain-containing protein [Chitinophaga deserti]